jgi:hypothetical protein
MKIGFYITIKRNTIKNRIIVILTDNNQETKSLSYFMFRIKNERESKTRVLSTLLKKDPTYSIKEFREERDAQDDNHTIISLTVYEKVPYCRLKKILRELRESSDIECISGSSSDKFLYKNQTGIQYF